MSFLFIYTSASYACVGPSLLETGAPKELTKPCYSYLLRFQFPPSIKQIPLLRGYYKGASLEFENDFCIISEDTECMQFTLFVTNPKHAPQPKAEGNNIKYFERFNDKCRLFYITRKTDKEQSSWIVKEEEVKNMPLRIPDDATILLMKPKDIELLKDDTDPKLIESAVKFSKVNTILLPKIVVRCTATQADFDTLADKAACASIDLKATHPVVPKEVKYDNAKAVLITMRSPK